MAVYASLGDLVSMGFPYAAVEAGGDLRVHGVPPGESSWPVAVEIPSGHEEIALYGGALATSTAAKRHWTQGETVRHHILDPRTGEPAGTDLWSATVAAPICAQADVAAKCAFILGLQTGSDFLTHHRLAGLLVTSGGEVVRVGRWHGDGGQG
jgi:thiamine biosynthesis lipoprotein